MADTEKLSQEIKELTLELDKQKAKTRSLQIKLDLLEKKVTRITDQIDYT